MGLPLMEPRSAEDSSLVQETLAGSQASFQLLVERYQDRLFALVRHYTKDPALIEDIVQETCLKAFRRLEQRCSDFYHRPEVMRQERGFCREHLVLSSLWRSRPFAVLRRYPPSDQPGSRW
jgi:RNA polymerase sigma-70 factor (ECF subfamily)